MYTGVCASQYNVGHLYTRTYNFVLHVWAYYRLTQDSIMSLDMSLSRVSRCLPNSSSGQWRSRMNVCRASNFQKRSSDVPEPLLQSNHRSVSDFLLKEKWWSITPSPAWMTLIPTVYWRSWTSNRRTDKDGRYLQIMDHRSGVLYSQWTVWSSSWPGGWKVQLFSFLDVHTSFSFLDVILPSITLLYYIMAQEVQAQNNLLRQNKSWAFSFSLF